MPPKFNVSVPGLTLIVGNQGQGKSHLIRYLMYQNRKKFSYGLIFCNTDFSPDSFDFAPKKRIYSQFNEDKLVALMEIQKKNRDKHASYLILDDCVYGKQWNSQPFQQLITQLRHYNVWCCISAQYPYAIPTTLRANTFNCFMFSMGTSRAIEALYESYGQHFDHVSDFKQYLLKNTGNYQFISYDARNQSPEIADKYQVMKINSKIPKFSIN